MKLTEQTLLDGYQGRSCGMSCISLVEGKSVLWNYRRESTDGGYAQIVSQREEAANIFAECGHREIVPLSPECAGHPALETIRRDFQEIAGHPTLC